MNVMSMDATAGKPFADPRLLGAFAVLTVLFVGCQLVVEVAVTSNTGNILAWGILEGTDPLKRSPLALFTYEATHSTGTYSYLALGMWLFVLAQGVRYFQSVHDRPVRARHLYVSAVVVSLVSAALFMCWNLVLMTFSDSVPSQYWIDKVVFPLDSETASMLPIWRFAVLAVPAALLLPLAWFVRRDLGPWAIAVCVLAVPMLGAPVLMRRYMLHHFMCFGDPDVYAPTLKALGPALGLIPLTAGFAIEWFVQGPRAPENLADSSTKN